MISPRKAGPLGENLWLRPGQRRQLPFLLRGQRLHALLAVRQLEHPAAFPVKDGAAGPDGSPHFPLKHLLDSRPGAELAFLDQQKGARRIARFSPATCSKAYGRAVTMPSKVRALSVSHCPVPGLRWNRATSHGGDGHRHQQPEDDRPQETQVARRDRQPADEELIFGRWRVSLSGWRLGHVFLPRSGPAPSASRAAAAWVQQDPPVLDADGISGDLLLERRRRSAVLGLVLPAVPGAGDAAVHDLAFAQRPALVGADVGHRGHLAVEAKHRDALAAGQADRLGPGLGDLVHRADVDPAIVSAESGRPHRVDIHALPSTGEGPPRRPPPAPSSTGYTGRVSPWRAPSATCITSRAYAR